MTTEKRDAALEKMLADGIEAKAYNGYSGRGMFGAETAAITVSRPYDLDEARMIAGNCKYDQLGHGYILY